MRILLTNNTLGNRAGTELFVRDLSVALMRRGHSPVVFSQVLGAVAQELTKATVPVITDLRDLREAPDVIHGQHHLETMQAVTRFPRTPALFICHGWAPWQEAPPIFPSIKKYVAVDNLCRERLLTSRGVDPAQIETSYNFVDLQRFQPRDSLPEHPKKALIFSNHGSDNDLRVLAIKDACRRFGIPQVDLIGLAGGNPCAAPESILGDYDVVFAKARAALEAMACGCAVIISDYAGLGSHISMDNVEKMRQLNFGVRTMQAQRSTSDNILRELQRYDARDAEKVRDYIRKHADMEKSVERWIERYEQIIAQAVPSCDNAAYELKCLAATSRYLGDLSQGMKSVDQVFGLTPEVLRRKTSETQERLVDLEDDTARLHECVQAATNYLNELHLGNLQPEFDYGLMPEPLATQLGNTRETINRCKQSRLGQALQALRAMRHRMSVLNKR